LWAIDQGPEKESDYWVFNTKEKRLVKLSGAGVKNLVE